MSVPKGYIVSVGGAEDKGPTQQKMEELSHHQKFFEAGVLRNIINLIEEDKQPIVEVVTTASSIPEQTAQIYKNAFCHLGCDYVGHLHICSRDEADKPAILERLKNCNCLMFSGGDQLKLCSVFGGTKFLNIVKKRYINEHFVIAGTSAGAMAMSYMMIYEGDAGNAHLKGEVKMTTGFGFLKDVIIDTHFDKRGRFNRLAQAVAAQPGIIGIGLGEDTGIIVSGGHHLKAIGFGCVTIIDGKHINHNNIAEIDDGQPMSVGNLVVHIMSNSDVYNLRTRLFEGNMPEYK
jgi:cyanophycinase